MTRRPTDPTPLGASDDPGMLAAEYVLGVLDADEHARLTEREARDPAFAQSVTAWRARLSGLDDGFDPVAPPPQLLARINAALDADGGPAAVPENGAENGAESAPTVAPVVPLPRRTRAPLWGAALGLAAALALAVGLWSALVPTSNAPALTLIAALEPAGEQTDPARFDARYAPGALTVSRAGAQAPSGRDHELWLIAADGVPRSLGVLGTDTVTVAVTLEPGHVLAVSLEPVGGSTVGAPTGPVLAVGTLSPA